MATEGRGEEARAMYVVALDGREKVFGRDITKCKDVSRQLRRLDTSQDIDSYVQVTNNRLMKESSGLRRCSTINRTVVP